MRRRLTFVAATAVSLTLALAGCGDEEKTNTSSPAAGGTSASQAVEGTSSSKSDSGAGTGTGSTEWANSFCDPISKFTTDVQSKTPTIDSSDPKTAIIGFADYFDELSAKAGTVMAELKKLGSSPFNGGDQLKNTIIDTFGKAQESFKSSADKLRSGDAAAAEQVMQDLSAKMEDLASPVDNIQGGFGILQAMGDAPSCKSLSKR